MVRGEKLEREIARASADRRVHEHGAGDAGEDGGGC